MTRIDVDRTLRNVVLVLQMHPGDYRKFGPYWWPVKAMLKAKGYGRDDLTVLGDFMPPDAEDLAGKHSADRMLELALREYGVSHFTGMIESETADGGRYVCDDPDAGGL